MIFHLLIEILSIKYSEKNISTLILELLILHPSSKHSGNASYSIVKNIINIVICILE